MAEQRRKRIQELEDRVGQLRKKVDEQSRVIRLKEDAERSAKRLQQEISVRTSSPMQCCLLWIEAFFVELEGFHCCGVQLGWAVEEIIFQSLRAYNRGYQVHETKAQNLPRLIKHSFRAL